MFKVDSAGIRKQLKLSLSHARTHARTHKYQRIHLCVTVGTRLKYKKPVIYIINNRLTFRFVTSQIWKYYAIFGFVQNERGRIHEQKAPFRKQLSAKVYSFVSLCERRVQNQHMVTVSTLFSSAQIESWHSLFFCWRLLRAVYTASHGARSLLSPHRRSICQPCQCSRVQWSPVSSSFSLFCPET